VINIDEEGESLLSPIQRRIDILVRFLHFHLLWTLTLDAEIKDAHDNTPSTTPARPHLLGGREECKRHPLWPFFLLTVSSKLLSCERQIFGRKEAIACWFIVMHILGLTGFFIIVQFLNYATNLAGNMFAACHCENPSTPRRV
jgi:hypothetical protein